MRAGELKKLLGAEKYAKVVDYVKKLRAQGKTTDEIGEAVLKKFKGIPPAVRGVGAGFR